MIIQKAFILYNEALDLLKENNLSGAHTKLIQSVSLYAKDSNMLNLLGLCSFSLCDFNLAHQSWAQSLRVQEKDNKATEYLAVLESNNFKKLMSNYNLSLEYIHTDKMEKGINVLQKIIEDQADLVEPYLIIALCQIALDNHKEAGLYCRKALEKDAGNQLGARLIAHISSKSAANPSWSKRWVMQRGLVAAFIVMLITSTGGLFHLNNLYQKEKNAFQLYQVQVTDKSTAVANQEKTPPIQAETDKEMTVFFASDQTLFNRAYALFDKAEYSQALTIFRWLAKDTSKQVYAAESEFFSAYCLERLGQREEELTHLVAYIDKYPQGSYYDDALYMSGMLLHKAGREEEAKKYLKRLVIEEPDSIFSNSEVKLIIK